MEFCPECGAMLLPKNGKLECNCGFKQDLSDNYGYEVSEILIPTENIKVVGKIDAIKIDTSIYKPRRFSKIEK